MIDYFYTHAWLIPLLPLSGALLTGALLILFPEATRAIRRGCAFLSVTLMLSSCAVSILLFLEQWKGHPNYFYEISWLISSNLNLNIGYIIDDLSSLMLVLVSSVAFLVLIYSDGYMEHDISYVRFFVYLGLFSSSMLALVLSPNLIQVYIFWELIGACSYLLIGFWFRRTRAAHASQKAFVTNRVGDFGLLLGILGFYLVTGSFNFTEISAKLPSILENKPEFIGFIHVLCLLIFLGPISKSAQFPLHVWLPDAMEGPTPISALIHAATLVAAGIFLIARMFPIFYQFPLVMNIIAWTGGMTAFIGAIIATSQVDIKKCLAYSTMSQLGYMVMALGLGAYQAAIFHLLTHAYSKALLFLGSGSVIHGMEEVVGFNTSKNQDMRLMGGLSKYMPITSITFLIGTLSLCGVPPLACFWSKDAILAASLAQNQNLWFVSWLTAGLTSFYMFRLYFLTFTGELRANDYQKDTILPHESTTNMVLPLVILAIPSCLLGLINTPWNPLLSNYFLVPDIMNTIEIIPINEFLGVASSSVLITGLGFFISFSLYSSYSIRLQQYISKSPILNLYWLSKNKWYIDDVYTMFIMRIHRKVAQGILWIDQNIVDGLVYSVGWTSLLSGEMLRYIENGRLSSYLITFIIGFSFLIIKGISFIIF